jgi:hypothetical protein
MNLKERWKAVHYYVYVFENGNIAVFDDDGEQVPNLQKRWGHKKYLLDEAKRYKEKEEGRE